MSVQQFGMVYTELVNLKGKRKFVVNKTPLYIQYTDRKFSNRKHMYFVNSVDVCLLFYRGKISEEYLLNGDSELRNDLGNVKQFQATGKHEVVMYLFF